jgi:hypothetical protein
VTNYYQGSIGIVLVKRNEYADQYGIIGPKPVPMSLERATLVAMLLGGFGGTLRPLPIPVWE